MDYSLFHLINELAGQSAAMDAAMKAVAAYGPLLFAIPLAFLWFGGGLSGKKAVLLGLLTMGIALLIAQVIGHIHFRPRPFSSHEVNLLVPPSTDASFPSDHATFSFALAGIIFLENKRWGIASLALGVLIAFSRVFIGTHYPLDVIGGALISLGLGLLIWRLRGLLDPVLDFIIGVAKKLKLA